MRWCENLRFGKFGRRLIGFGLVLFVLVEIGVENASGEEGVGNRCASYQEAARATRFSYLLGVAQASQKDYLAHHGRYAFLQDELSEYDAKVIASCSREPDLLVFDHAILALFGLRPDSLHSPEALVAKLNQRGWMTSAKLVEACSHVQLDGSPEAAPVPAMQWGTCFGYILGILDGTGQLECSDMGRPSHMVNIGVRDFISALKRHIQKSPGGLPESAKDLVQEAWTAELCPRAGVE